jgi:hypothetical protein
MLDGERSPKSMNGPSSRLSTALVLLLGVAMGWAASSVRPTPLRAGSGDRSGESIVATGPAIVRYDEAVKASIPLEAVYLLDYKAGRLLATIPTYQQSASSTHIVDEFVERDLVADFHVDLDDPSLKPRFLMTTGSLGPYTAGWAPLYVFETTSKQLGIYRIQIQQSTAKSSRPKFERVELRSYGKAGGSEPGR